MATMTVIRNQRTLISVIITSPRAGFVITFPTTYSPIAVKDWRHKSDNQVASTNMLNKNEQEQRAKRLQNKKSF